MRNLLVPLLLLAAVLARAEGVTESTFLESRLAMSRAARYLLNAQQEDGSWAGHPGITAAGVFALGKSPLAEGEEVQAAIARATAHIRKHARENGAIGLPARDGDDIYATAICAMALTMLDAEEHARLIADARKFLMRSQERDGLAYTGLGTGYRSGYPDLSNTHWALEALRVTRTAGDPRDARFWGRAERLIAACQLRDGEDAGGFTYRPIDQPRQPVRHEEVALDEAWGSLTCGGIKSLRYAGAKADDPRVVKGMAWLREHYTVKANPGLDDGGLYYWYYMLASTLAIAEVDGQAETAGPLRSWREDLLDALLCAQKGDGRWANDNPLWLENRPELCTAYAMLTITMATATRP